MRGRVAALAVLAAVAVLTALPCTARAQTPSTPAAAAAPVPARPSPEASDAVGPLLAEGRRLIDDGRPRDALQRLRGAGVDDPRVHTLIGVAAYHANDPLQAIAELARVLDRLPQASLERQEAVQVLGLSHYLAGHLAEAIPFLEQTRAFAPESSELSHVLGMAYVQTRQAERARETWARAYHVPADSAAGHLLAAQMEVHAEMEDMARAELLAALSKDPRLPQANLLLGQAALFRGRLDEAVSLFEKELAVDPGSAMAFYSMGDAYTRRQQWDRALEALQRSVWLNPYYSGPYILMGKAYQAKGDRAAAEGMLRRALLYDPNNKAAHYLLAQVLQQLGRAEDARQEFEAARRLAATAER